MSNQYYAYICSIRFNKIFSCNVSECAHSFAKLAAEIDQMVTRMIFESYGLEKYHEAYIGSITYLLRLLKHKAPQGNDPRLGFVAHTDKSFTTILYQNHINALEVETKNGDWIKVELSPSSFVVFAGDALMVGAQFLDYKVP